MVGDLPKTCGSTHLTCALCFRQSRAYGRAVRQPITQQRYKSQNSNHKPTSTTTCLCSHVRSRLNRSKELQRALEQRLGANSVGNTSRPLASGSGHFRSLGL
eukprot:1695097-Amphidinium_carterae.2